MSREKDCAAVGDEGALRIRRAPCGCELAALAWEAHKRGLTYGELAARVTKREMEEIVKDWKKDKKVREGLSYQNAVRRAGGDVFLC